MQHMGGENKGLGLGLEKNGSFSSWIASSYIRVGTLDTYTDTPSRYHR